MKLTRFLSLMTFSIIALSLGLTSCKKDDPIVIPTELAYAGSETCQQCHSEKYDMFIESGHPYKLNKVVGGVQPYLPWTDVSIPLPVGYTWSDVTYMIGGYGWKSRWTDANGYIITKNADTQYNLADGSQVAYHAGDEIGTKKYDCGRCHTTGWEPVADGEVGQDGLPGMAGTFFAGGIHCESCHGQGNIHAVTESASDITVDKSDLLCGQCHTRNADRSIAAKGGFIQHHEQYDELLTSGHNSKVGCVDCHDPHASVKHDAKAKGQGVTTTCVTCHSTYNTDKHVNGDVTCVTCHMPKATKSAIKTGDYMGDIKTHIFDINPAADGKLFNDAGNLANPDGLGMSLDYACYQCHKDAQGLGGSNSTKTMDELSAKATNFHGTK